MANLGRDKAAYLAKIDDIIDSSFRDNRTECYEYESIEKPMSHIVTPDSTTSSAPGHSINLLSWIEKTKKLQQNPNYGRYNMASQKTSPDKQDDDTVHSVSTSQRYECEEGEISDSDMELSDEEDVVDGEPEEDEEDDAESWSSFSKYEERSDVDENEKTEEEEEKKDEKGERTEFAPGKKKDFESGVQDLVDDNIAMNLHSMKQSAIDQRLVVDKQPAIEKHDKQLKLTMQLQKVVCRVVREFGNLAKLTLLKEQLHTNMEKLTKVLTSFEHVFNMFTHNGCAHVKVLPQLDLCEEFCTRGGCHKENCNDLHMCKFYMLGLHCHYGDVRSKRGKKRGCHFGHFVSKHMLNHFLLGKLSADEMVGVLRQRRSMATVPKVCKHYNFENRCRNGDEGAGCVALHVCRYFIKGDCRFADHCKRSHSLQDEQPACLLKKAGLDPEDEETCKRLNECYENGSFVLPFVPIKSEEPMKSHRNLQQKRKKLRKETQRKETQRKGMTKLKFTVTPGASEDVEICDEEDQNERSHNTASLLPAPTVLSAAPPPPRPQFHRPPPHQPPMQPMIRLNAPFGPHRGPFAPPHPKYGSYGPVGLHFSMAQGPPMGLMMGPQGIRLGPRQLGPPPMGPGFVGPALVMVAASPGMQSAGPQASFLSPPPDVPSKFERPAHERDAAEAEFSPEHDQDVTAFPQRPTKQDVAISPRLKNQDMVSPRGRNLQPRDPVVRLPQCDGRRQSPSRYPDLEPVQENLRRSGSRCGEQPDEDDRATRTRARTPIDFSFRQFTDPLEVPEADRRLAPHKRHDEQGPSWQDRRRRSNSGLNDDSYAGERNHHRQSSPANREDDWSPARERFPQMADRRRRPDLARGHRPHSDDRDVSHDTDDRVLQRPRDRRHANISEHTDAQIGNIWNDGDRFTSGNEDTVAERFQPDRDVDRDGNRSDYPSRFVHDEDLRRSRGDRRRAWDSNASRVSPGERFQKDVTEPQWRDRPRMVSERASHRDNIEHDELPVLNFPDARYADCQEHLSEGVINDWNDESSFGADAANHQDRRNDDYSSLCRNRREPQRDYPEYTAKRTFPWHRSQEQDLPSEYNHRGRKSKRYYK